MLSTKSGEKLKRMTFQRNQEENRKLSSSLTAATERDSGVSEDESYIEIDLVHKLQVDNFHFSYSDFHLQGTVEKQREQIRDLDSELSNVKADLEELKGQNDRLSTSNKVRSMTVMELCHKTILCSMFRSYGESCDKAKTSSIALSMKELSFRQGYFHALLVFIPTCYWLAITSKTNLSVEIELF